MLKKCVFLLYKNWGINIRLALAISKRFNPAARMCNKQKTKDLIKSILSGIAFYVLKLSLLLYKN